MIIKRERRGDGSFNLISFQSVSSFFIILSITLCSNSVLLVYAYICACIDLCVGDEEDDIEDEETAETHMDRVQ